METKMETVSDDENFLSFGYYRIEFYSNLVSYQ